MTFLRRIFAIVAGIGLILSGPARADLTQQMDTMFNALVNVSPAGAYSTQARGVISGGSVYVRSRVMNADLISFAPPRIEAGCGGLDFFAGSFSFINAEQFTQLLRSIASNAAGYAFQLALGAMCEDCMGTIETLQKKIQELNQHLGNSCQLAQGLVNDTLGAAVGKKIGDASLIGTFEGGADDFFSGWTTSGGQNPVDKAQTASPDETQKRVYGNLVWRALKKQNVSSWFSAGDNDLLQVAMNVTGTIIVPPPESGSTDSRQITTKTVVPNAELLTAIVEGKQVTIQGCADGTEEDECVTLTAISIDLTGKGFKQRVRKALLGDATSQGIIAKLRNPSLGVPTPFERAVLGVLPGGAGGMVVRLAHYSDAAARQFAGAASDSIAIQMAEMLVKSSLESVEAAMSASDDGFAKEALDLMGRAREQINDEVARLTDVQGMPVDRLVGMYQAYMAVMPTQAIFDSSVVQRAE